jgi:hypothetical protein
MLMDDDRFGRLAARVLAKRLPDNAAGMVGVDYLEQIDEGIATAFVCGEAEDLAASNIMGAHEAKCAG